MSDKSVSEFAACYKTNRENKDVLLGFCTYKVSINSTSNGLIMNREATYYRMWVLCVLPAFIFPYLVPRYSFLGSH